MTLQTYGLTSHLNGSPHRYQFKQLLNMFVIHAHTTVRRGGADGSPIRGAMKPDPVFAIGPKS